MALKEKLKNLIERLKKAEEMESESVKRIEKHVQAMKEASKQYRKR